MIEDGKVERVASARRLLFRFAVPSYSSISTRTRAGEALLWAGCVALAGCTAASVHQGGTAPRRPMMPTISPAAAATDVPAPLPDADIVAAVVRRARAGEITAAISMLKAADSSKRGRLGEEAVSILADDNPALAATLALALPPGTSQITAVDLAGRAWVLSDPNAALAWAMQLPEANAAIAGRRAVTTELVRTDPAAAIDLIQAFPAGNARDDTLVLAAVAWARRRTDEALAWLGRLPEDAFRERLTSSMGFELAQSNPKRALELAEQLPEGRNRWLLLSAIAQTWVAVDAKAALAWAQDLPAGEARLAAFAGVETGFGVPSSRTVVSVPGTRGGSSRTRGGAAAALAAREEANSPTFVAWLETQPPGLTREEAILEYVRQRGASEPEAVARLLAQVGGTVRQQAIDLQVENLLTTSPERAADFLRSLPRSEQSPDAIERTARRLAVTNPAALEVLLDQALLPPDRKAELLREAPR